MLIETKEIITNITVNRALDTIDVTYDQLIEVANDIFEATCKEIDELMVGAYNDIEKMSNDAVRDLMLRLSLKSYTFSEIKEKSQFKAILGEVHRKWRYDDKRTKIR